MLGRPQASEAAPYYFTYIDRITSNDVVPVIARQLDETLAWCATISEERSRFRYAPDKWSMRQVLNHITDAERAFTFRALWFAPGLHESSSELRPDRGCHRGTRRRHRMGSARRGLSGGAPGFAFVVSDPTERGVDTRWSRERCVRHGPRPGLYRRGSSRASHGHDRGTISVAGCRVRPCRHLANCRRESDRSCAPALAP